MRNWRSNSAATSGSISSISWLPTMMSIEYPAAAKLAVAQKRSVVLADLLQARDAGESAAGAVRALRAFAPDAPACRES